MNANRLTLRAVLLGMLASGLFAWYTVIMENAGGERSRILTATQIPVLPFLLLMACVAILNPALRRLRIVRTLSRAEVMLIFIMTTVSSGISTFGLASQLVPAVAGLFNRNWNTAQSRWDRHIEPFVNESWFLAERGIGEQAQAARAAEDAWLETEGVLRVARRLSHARRAVDELERQGATAEESGRPTPPQVSRQLLIERSRLEGALASWTALAPPDADVETVLSNWPDKVAELAAGYERERAALAALETVAFGRVEQFRRGLPAPLRAVPGILPTDGEPLGLYTARLRRWRAGLPVSGDLAAARRALAEGRDEAGVSALRRAAERFAAVAQTEALAERREAVAARRETIAQPLTETRREVEQLRAQRRLAEADTFDVLDRAIRTAQAEADRLAGELQALDHQRDRIVDPQLALAREAGEFRETLWETAGRWAAGAESQRLVEALDQLETELENLNMSWRSFFAGDVPWGQWTRPLARWSLLVLTVYMMLMTFNALIFRQWAHHEKLSYPLAELPLMLGGADADAEADPTGGVDAGRVPAIYRTGVFWVGFAISAFIMGWNILATRQIVPGINPIPLRFPWEGHVVDSLFAGLLPNAQHQIFFTMIGIAFLIPARISKSLWSFHLFYMGLLLALVWMGFGADERSFPANMTMVLNFRSGVGGGALIAFSLMILWTCRHYLLCVALPRSLDGLAAAERKELRISSFLFLASSVLAIGIVTFGMGVHWGYAIFGYLMIIMVTIGMVRGVAEGGLLVFQCHFGPFHFIRSALGMHRSWTSVSLFAPLLAFYYVLFWDLKTFIAPAMANAFKIRDSLGLRRLGFHLSVWLGILIAAGVSVLTHIVLGYHRGANTMHGWFYSHGPQQLFGSITEMAVANPFDTAGGRHWMLAGFAIMAGLLSIRRHKAGLLHPIGLVMWVHPGMWALWFSIFLGWAFKSLVGRYGDRLTYHKFRLFFIGMIAGELLMCLFGVDLNRH